MSCSAGVVWLWAETRERGAFCGIDPLFTWTATIASDDQSMQLNPNGHDHCGGRVAILQGTWTRTQ
jgi:hypothetical protein